MTPDPVVEETEGELGHGTFRWSCTERDEDPTCGTGIFPAAVAQHSEFGLQFLPDDDVPTTTIQGEIDVESVSAARVAEVFDGFAALQVGHISMLARGGDYGVDFIELDVRAVDDVQVRERYVPDCGEALECADEGHPVGGEVTLHVHDVVRVQAVPFGEGTELAGALPYTWESLSNDLVVSAVSGGLANLEARAEGTLRLRVTAGEFVQVLTFEAQPAQVPESTDDGSAGSTGGSGTDGTDSGSDDSGSDDSGSDSSGSDDSGSDSSGTDGEGASSTGAM